MEETSQDKVERQSEHLVAGIFAHVDAGKTTLAESLLYCAGVLKKRGRVDHRDAFLDTYDLERERGITIFAKQARFEAGGFQFTLLDTPGHVDFSLEMERTLQVLDYAILVISGSQGIQGHTRTVWSLLAHYHIPTVIFVNKMDLAGTDKTSLLAQLQQQLSTSCLAYDLTDEKTCEELSLLDETLLEKYLTTGNLDQTLLQTCFGNRQFFPVFFGSALKYVGIQSFLESFVSLCEPKTYPDTLGLKVFKITRDKKTRLTLAKVTGGHLYPKTMLEEIDEKIDEIRLYSGSQYEMVRQAEPGEIVSLTGLQTTYAGQSLGCDQTPYLGMLEPVLVYQLDFCDEVDDYAMYGELKTLEEEIPELEMQWNAKKRKIYVRVMGEVQMEILKSLILERLGVSVEMHSGNIVYQETITQKVEGVGHFEPLRHYAEVHLLLEPLPRGSGVQIASQLSLDELEANWQHLILSHLESRRHPGVLTGAEITDLKITLVAGRAHLKHTEGGDFREATYRALRQGLMKAKSILLEPLYRFTIEVPNERVGRALADLTRLGGTYDEPTTQGEMTIIQGTGPVATLKDYPQEVISYTKGLGRVSFQLEGYAPCHDQDKIMAQSGYDPLADTENPCGSVFCSHGAGFYVPYDEVENYMHLEARYQPPRPQSQMTREIPVSFDAEDDLKRIFTRTYGEYEDERYLFRSRQAIHEGKSELEKLKADTTSQSYLLVDGYNIIFSWDELKELAKTSLDAARFRLMDILCNYQGLIQATLILVFDAYKVQGNPGMVEKYHNIYVVYTREAETADNYIEKTVHEIGHHHHVTVATSDGMEQLIILGQGGVRISARGLKKEIDFAMSRLRQDQLANPSTDQKGTLLESASEADQEVLKAWRLEKKAPDD